MRSILVLAALVLATQAWADGTVEERQTAVKLYRGSSIIAASDPNHPTYRPNFTMPVCMGLKDQSRDAEAVTREEGKATYKCQLEERDIVRFHPAPMLTCGDRPGHDEQEQRTCPAGTVGTWLQERIWTLRPYPECWIQGDWTPAEPPAGMCAPADSDGDGVPDPADECPTVYASTPNGCPATPPAQLAAPTNVQARGISTSEILVTWDAVAGAAAYSLRRCIGSSCEPMDRTPLICTRGAEQRHVSLPAGLTVSYRVQASASADCSEPGAPSDPIVRGTTLSATPEPAGTATLSWTPPTQNTNGTVLTDLAGYRVSYGSTRDELVHTVQIPNAGASSYTISDLAPGEYFFAVRAYTSSGTESGNSNIVSKVIR